MLQLRLLPLAIFGAVLLIPQCGFAAVVINEIAWMGSLPQAGETSAQAANNEWMELFNDGAQAVDLTGWRIEAADGTPAVALSGSIAAGGFFLLERTDDGAVAGVPADLIYAGALSNSGETLAVKDAVGEVVDTVEASSGWPAGDNATKDTMQRSGAGWITASPTPRAANAASATPAPPPAPPPAAVSGDSPPPAPAPPPAPSLGADAGPDATAIAGAIVQFKGTAFGLDGEPLDPAGSGMRFLWNFGDGSTQEKQFPTHIFHFPGMYHVNLLVQSGHYAGSDWQTITVLPAEISISEVQPGENGFVEIANASAVRLDIGGMFLTDDLHFVFRVPAGTVIGARSVGVLPAVITRLAPTAYLDLRDARGVSLDTARFGGDLPPDASWERIGSEFRPQAKPTPGMIATPLANPPQPQLGSPPAAAPAPLPPRSAPAETPVSAPQDRTPAENRLAQVSAGSRSPYFLVGSAILGAFSAVLIVMLKRGGRDAGI